MSRVSALSLGDVCGQDVRAMYARLFGEALDETEAATCPATRLRMKKVLLYSVRENPRGGRPRGPPGRDVVVGVPKSQETRSQAHDRASHPGNQATPATPPPPVTPARDQDH